MVVYKFVLSGKEAAKEVFFSSGENSAFEVLEVCEVHFRICNKNIKTAFYFP